MSGHRAWRELRDARLASMTDEQRAEAEAARERARGGFEAERAEYLAMFEGAPTSPLFPEGFGAVLGEILAPPPPTEQDGPPWVHHFPHPGLCGHCGQPPRGYGFADGVALCHTGTLPAEAEPPDCFRLVTVFDHAADGSCCRGGANA